MTHIGASSLSQDGVLSPLFDCLSRVCLCVCMASFRCAGVFSYRGAWLLLSECIPTHCTTHYTRTQARIRALDGEVSGAEHAFVRRRFVVQEPLQKPRTKHPRSTTTNVVTAEGGRLDGKGADALRTYVSDFYFSSCPYCARPVVLHDFYKSSHPLTTRGDDIRCLVAGSHHETRPR